MLHTLTLHHQNDLSLLIWFRERTVSKFIRSITKTSKRNHHPKFRQNTISKNSSPPNRNKSNLKINKILPNADQDPNDGPDYKKADWKNLTVKLFYPKNQRLGGSCKGKIKLKIWSIWYVLWQVLIILCDFYYDFDQIWGHQFLIIFVKIQNFKHQNFATSQKPTIWCKKLNFKLNFHIFVT